MRYLLIIVICLFFLLIYLITRKTKVIVPIITTVSTTPSNTTPPVQTTPSNTTPPVQTTPTMTTKPLIVLNPSTILNQYNALNNYKLNFNCTPAKCPPISLTDYCQVQSIVFDMPSIYLGYPRNININKITIDISSLDTSCIPSGYTLKGNYTLYDASEIQYNRGNGIRSTSDITFKQVSGTRYEVLINKTVPNQVASRYKFTIIFNSNIKTSFILQNMNVEYTLTDIVVPTPSTTPIQIIDGMIILDGSKGFQINNLVKNKKENIYKFNFNTDGSCTGTCSCPTQSVGLQLDDYISKGETQNIKIFAFADVKDYYKSCDDPKNTPQLFYSWSVLFYSPDNTLIQQCGFGPDIPTLENFDKYSLFNTISKYPVTTGYRRYATFLIDSLNKVPAGTYKVVLRIFSPSKNNTAIVTNLNVMLSL